MIHSSLLLFVLVMKECNALYNRENEDPGAADPLFSISCSGPNPPFVISLDGTEYTPPSIQSLCAQKQYGGGPPERNAGGYCPLRTNIRKRFGTDDNPILRKRAVQFNRNALNINAISDQIRIDDRIISVRIEAYCILRCVCSGVNEDQRANPRLSTTTQATQGDRDLRITLYGREGSGLSFVALEVLHTQYPARKAIVPHPDPGLRFLTTYNTELLGPFADRIDIPTYIRTHTLPYVESDFDNHDHSDVLLKRFNVKNPYTIEDENQIICDNVWPEGQPLPAPARREDFDHLLEICAVGLSGGNLKYNAGAFCHRHPSPGHENDADVWFSDEMTPLKEWTWDWLQYTTYNRFLAPPVVLRRHCWSHCRCKAPRLKLRRKNRIMATVWPLLEFDVERLDTLLGLPNLQDNLPKSKLKGARFSCWSWFSTTWCSDPYNLANFNEIKRHLPPIRRPYPSHRRPKPMPLPPLIGASGSESAQSDSCGHKCRANAECLSLVTVQCNYLARCAVDPSSLTQTVLGSVANVVAAYSISRCIGQPAKPNGLGGRDVGRHSNTIPADEDAKGWPCACNSTYVSYVCCSSSNGIVWEDPRLHLGSLEL